MNSVSENSLLSKPLGKLTSLGWVALTVIVGQSLSEFVVPPPNIQFRFLALFGTILGLGPANLLNISRRALLVLLAVCLLIGWGATACFSVVIGTGVVEAGVKLYLILSLLLILAFASFGAALRMAGLASEASDPNEEESGEQTR